MVDLLLGVDGGGSKTRALLADVTGEILGQGIAGSSNYQVVGFETATQAITAAIDEALQEIRGGVPMGGARSTPERRDEHRISAACLGLAGVDRPADHALFTQWLEERQLAPRYRIVNDSALVLAAGTPQGWGVALIAGTGSIGYGVGPDGQQARAGGWGYLLGDEGSAYDLAIQALRLATQTADGRAEAPAILHATLEHWNLAQPEDLIGFTYRAETTRTVIAGLAQPILALAEGGDPHAQELLEQAAIELGRHVDIVARRLGLTHPPLALGGGLLCRSGHLRDLVCSHTEVELGPVAVVEDPARGALAIAGRLLGAS